MLNSKGGVRRRLSLVLGVLLLLLIAVLSLMPGYAPPGHYHADKFIHAGFYCLFTFLWLFGTDNHSRIRHLAVAMAVLMYGILLELLQQYVGGRTVSVADIGANITGVTLAVLIRILLNRSLIGFG